MASSSGAPFIKVDINGLRRLVRQHHLRRAELGELLLLALYIDDQGICWPSKADSVGKIDMRSPHWARKLHMRLKDKGVLSWDFDHEKRSPRFHLPRVFFFGADSYRDHNTESRGDRNTDPRRGSNTESRGDRNTDPEQEPQGTRTTGGRTKKSQQTGAVSFENGGLPLISKAQQRLIRQLSEAGVSDLESYLIATQYCEQTIEKAIADSQKTTIKNPGGWIRRAVELIAHEDIIYPTGASQKAMRAAAAMAVMAIRKTNPYTSDDYFTRHQAELTTPEDGDYNPDGEYNPMAGDTGRTDYRQAQRYNQSGDPGDEHLPF